MIWKKGQLRLFFFFKPDLEAQSDGAQTEIKALCRLHGKARLRRLQTRGRCENSGPGLPCKWQVSVLRPGATEKRSRRRPQVLDSIFLAPVSKAEIRALGAKSCQNSLSVVFLFSNAKDLASC